MQRQTTWIALVAVALMATSSGTSSAHFGNSDGTPELRRYIILAPSEDGLDVFIRHPAPLVFLDEMRSALEKSTSMISPWLAPKTTSGGLRYRLLTHPINQDHGRFKAQVKRALMFTQFGRQLPLEVAALRVGGRSDEIPFTNPAQAARSIDWRTLNEDPWLDEAVVEVHYKVEVMSTRGPIQIQSGVRDLNLSAFITIDNHIIDARSDTLAPLEVEGQLSSPVRLDGSRLRPILSFIFQGILHILGGLDHVLFVLCLALGATGLRALFWVITGFSAGHSLTLIAGFLGAVPSGDWFIPAVESVIAASIVYAGWRAYRNESAGVLTTSALGLVHGLGFAFVLGDILGPEADALVECLIAFNIGVEVGQLGLVGAVVMLRWGLIHRAPAAWRLTRLCVLTVAVGLSLFWTVERAMMLIG